MSQSEWIEWIGYAASVAVAASLTMTSVVRLRIWNLVGALAFTVYGALVAAWPVFGVNLFIAIVNVTFLWRLERQREMFETLRIASPESRYLRRFLDFYGDDIAAYFPQFDLDRLVGRAYGELRIVFTLRDLVPASLLVYELRSCGRALVHLDYSTPAHRDLRNARYLFREMNEELGPLRVSEMVAKSWHPKHHPYLERLGFALRTETPDHRIYVREVPRSSAAAQDQGPTPGHTRVHGSA